MSCRFLLNTVALLAGLLPAGLTAAALVCSDAPSALAQSTQTVDTPSGKLDFELGVPTKETVTKLYDEMDYQRANQLYLWALPIVGFANLQDILKGTTGALPDDLTIYLGNEQSVFLTPNATTPYILAYLDLAKTGPVVMEMPPGAIAGSSMDFWQRPLSDLGVTGPDQGKGGKYIFVGPGQEAPAAKGAFVLQSPTFGVVLFYRTLDPDQAKGEALARLIRVYPWAARDNPPATRFLKPDPNTFANFTTMPRGMKFWEQLAAVLQREPLADRDRFFMAMLMPLGIEKGKPFQPDARQKKILTEGAFVGEAMAKALTFDPRFPNVRYRPDANWQYGVLLDPMQDLPTYSQLDQRAGYFYFALCVTKGMLSQTVGVGQAYLGSFRDKEGHAFDGAKSYHLHVPPNPPAKQFWSVTIYDMDTRSIILNKERIAIRGSRDDLVKNADGSVDLYFAATAPKGFEKNWIQTVPGQAWFAAFRFYAPLEPYFDRSWPLPDIEEVK
jgi:hypothetical protein